jgi:hypothetical protein
MSDNGLNLGAVDWKNTFPFTRIFSAFRVAIQPSKLVLAMVAIMLLYFGGRVLDFMWDGVHLSEIQLYEQRFFTRSGDSQAEINYLRTQSLAKAKADYDELQGQLWKAKIGDGSTEEMPATFGRDEMTQQIIRSRDAAISLANQTYTNADEKHLRHQDIRAAFALAEKQYAVITERKGHGVFKTFLSYQAEQVNGVATAVFQLRLVGRDNTLGTDGVFGRVFNFTVIGPGWALSQRPVYFILLGLWGAFVWAVLGGAIARIAAVEIARQEKISIRNALRFSLAKMVSFASAPIMPVVIVVGFALALALLGWLTEVSYVGPVVMVVISVAFVLVIILSVMLVLALLGTVFGFGLMYPTISVEGSDSFDAISRSFSYVYARPWRMIFYSLVAIFHGAVTYMFLRFMVWMTLLLAHVCLLLWTTEQHQTGMSIASSFSAPQFHKLYTPPASINLTGVERFASFFLTLWTYAFTTLLAAFLLTLYQSASTIIYYLLRREVDATQLDDVYLEPSDEEFDEEELAAPEAESASTKPAPPAAPAPPTAPAEPGEAPAN